MPLIGAAAIGAAGSIGGALVQSHAANRAQQAQAQALQQAIGGEQKIWGQTQAGLQPFQQAGQRAVGQLSGLMAPGGALMQPWNQPFVAPTGATEFNDPGYQFRLQQGMEALQRSAAAQGNLLTGGTMKDITNYAQNYASNEYSNVYNRALTEYQQRYNIFQANQANQFNRLAALSGAGQTAAGQLGSLGLGTAHDIAGLTSDIGAARATGYINRGNIWGGALTGVTGDISQALMLRSLMNAPGQGGGGGGGGGGIVNPYAGTEGGLFGS
jgi:hypothetical protein